MMGDAIPRYWALIILSVIYRIGGAICLVITIISVFAFTATAEDIEQPAPLPTFPAPPQIQIPILPTLEILEFEIPEFNFRQPPTFPTVDTGQLTTSLKTALGGFAALFVLIWGLAASIGLYALGQFLVLMIDHEENMRITARGLESRVRRK